MLGGIRLVYEHTCDLLYADCEGESAQIMLVLRESDHKQDCSQAPERVELADAMVHTPWVHIMLTLEQYESKTRQYLIASLFFMTFWSFF